MRICFIFSSLPSCDMRATQFIFLCHQGMMFWAVGIICYCFKNAQLHDGQLQPGMAASVSDTHYNQRQIWLPFASETFCF